MCKEILGGAPKSGSTGEWIAEYGFKEGKMRMEDISTFTPHAKSDGRFVTVITSVECDSASKKILRLMAKHT